jgi:hypothetical protein
MGRHKYLYVNPRGFRNEFTIYAVPLNLVPIAERLAEKYNDDPNSEAYFICRREAEEMLRHERQLARKYIKAGLNLHCNPVGATEFTPFPADLDYE